MRVRKPRRFKWQLSFASMSDIAFLLIIFFAVAGKFTKTTQQGVMLPTVDLGDVSQLRELELIVTKEGEYFVNGTKVEPDGLVDELSAYVTEDMDREARTVRLHADRDAEYGAVARAIEAVNKADAYLELAVKFTQ